MQKIDHRNVVNYYETYEDADDIYLCMELCRGGELSKYIKDKQIEKKFNEGTVAGLFLQLLHALNHIHHKGIIHRDIKPENIMFDKPGGTVKFIDFGLACQMKNIKKFDQAGTPKYMAPEAFKGKSGAESDIWSLGVVIYLFMSGHAPFQGKSMEKLEANVLN